MLSVCRWYVAVQCQRRVGSVGRSARSLVTGLVCMHIGTRLVGSQGISVAIVIGLIAAADTGRFEKVEDGKYVGIVDACWCYRRVLAGFDSFSGVIIVVMRATRRKEVLICRLC